MQHVARSLSFRNTQARLLGVAAIAAAAAIWGFALGNVTAGTESAVQSAGVLLTKNGALQYPAGWHPVAGPGIPGLELIDAASIAPDGARGAAGLTVGELPAAAGSSLPASLLARIQTPIRAEVVSLGGFDAYRYAGLRVAGLDKQLTLDVIPGTGKPSVVACYAPPAAAGYLQACRQIVATFQFQNTPAYPLAPSGQYARAVTAAIVSLDARRRAERAALRGQPWSSGQAAVAARLAAAFGAAALALGRAPAPEAARSVAGRLVATLSSGQAAYRALSTAAGNQDGAAYDRARASAARAETAVGAALVDLAALGYGVAGPGSSR